MVSPRTFWVGMIVGLLGLSVGVNLYVLFAFGESPKDSLEEDWEARAENWNEYQEQHTENRKLGWKLDVIEEEPQGAGPITFPLNLLDKDKKPIQGAKITLVMSHNAHYSERQRVEATELEPGRRISIESTQSTFPIQVTRSVQPLGEGRCRVTAHVRGQPGWPMSMMSGMVRRSIRKDYERLKARLESQG